MTPHALTRRAFAISWKDLERWDVKYFSVRISSSFPVVRLAPFITEHSERVKPFEYPNDTFRILGVTNTGGIFHAYDCLGKEIKQPYQRVNADDFAYNPYRVNVGSIGIVPQEFAGNYISPAYVVFATDKKRLLPSYLLLLLKAEWFNSILRAATAGSVRQNLTFDLLGSLQIPLPTVSQQAAIVAHWRKSQAQIASARAWMEKKRAEIEARFLADLGLNVPSPNTAVKYFAVWWRDFLRWSVSYSQQRQASVDITRGKFPVVALGSLLDFVQYGTSEKANRSDKGVAVLRMNNIIDGELEFSKLKHVSLSAAEAEKLLLKDGDILFNRTNSKELVGKCAVFHSAGDFVFASYLIRVRADPSKAEPDFLAYAINSRIGRQQIDAVSRQIIGQANVNSTELREFQIPLPPLLLQRRIMDRVRAGRGQIAKKRLSASRLESTIGSDIEALVTGKMKLPIDE